MSRAKVLIAGWWRGRVRIRIKLRVLVLRLFKFIVRRRIAEFERDDELAFSGHFKETMVRIASLAILKILYPFAHNLERLPYFSFVYWQIAALRQDKPIFDVVWNDPALFAKICCLPHSYIILILHNGFAHGTRALSYSRKSLAAVIAHPEKILAFYNRNKVSRPEGIEIVPVNRETFLRLIEVAKGNKAIICAPDAINPKTGEYSILSSAMFQFAVYQNLPLYVFDFYLDRDCVLRGLIKGPIDSDLGSVSAVEEFISFCKSVSGRDFKFVK